ncbi:hypothetical protein C8R45DRAFT_450085 [Mycena sanguinolenta]|nr:hypothetical protein C8R45DRAFT_450085 [Mycena sanguinolenta]
MFFVFVLNISEGSSLLVGSNLNISRRARSPMFVAMDVTKQRVFRSTTSMSWAEHLKKAKAHLKCSRFDESLKEINEALRVGGDREHAVYDSRAAIYERQGKHKSALQDVKNVIKLAPTQWQGYARASRLFLAVRKLDEATTMADMALSRLDSKDALPRKKLQELKLQVLEQRRRQINHFGKLPVEIITTIFEMVVASNWSRVLTIWAVSRHWYNIALNTPNLWSTLVLTKRHPVRHAQRWIERSKGRIREISLRPTLPRALVKFDGMLWSHLRICKLEDHDIAEYIGGRSKLDRLSNLEELQVKGTESVNCDPLLRIPDSALRRLTLDGPRFTWDVLASNHRTLTSLDVRNSTQPSLEELLAVLESNPTLEQLILDFNTGGPLSTESPPSVTLPYLHTLHLGNTPWVHFFASVTTPSLETVRLSRVRSLQLQPLVEQQLQLVSISVNSCIVSSTDVLRLLLNTSNLRSLQLTRLFDISNTVLKNLGAAAGIEAPMCPALEELDISHSPDVVVSSIVDLLNARNPEPQPNGAPTTAVQEPTVPASARIRTLKADGCPLIQANFIPWIRARVETFSCIYMTKREASWKR